MKQGVSKGGWGVSGFSKTSPSEAPTTSGFAKRRGAPPGNQRAFKTGRYSGEVLGKLKEVRHWIRATRTILAKVNKDTDEKIAEQKRHRKRGPRKRRLKP